MSLTRLLFILFLVTFFYGVESALAKKDIPRQAVFTMAVLETANAEVLTPFLQSLRDSGYQGDIVIWTERPRILKNKLRSFRVITELADMSEIEGGKNELYTPAEYNTRAVHGRGINIWRFELYLRYLRANPGRWDHILLVDSNDVVFQRDLFAELQKKRDGDSLATNDIHFFAERMKYQTILQQAAEATNTNEFWQFDKTWLKACYGEHFIRRLADESLICAGVMLGSERGVVHLLEQLMAEWRRCHKPGSSDQGHINYLVYSGALQRNFRGEETENENETPRPFAIKIWQWGNDLVMHLNIPIRHSTPSRPPPISENRKKEVLTYWIERDSNGHSEFEEHLPVAVVHQYNRSPFLVDWAKRRWNPSSK